MVRVPAPTLVPKEFATSLPPMLKAMNRPKAIARISRNAFTFVPVWENVQIEKATTVASVISPAPRCQLRSGPSKPGEAAAAEVLCGVEPGIVDFPRGEEGGAARCFGIPRPDRDRRHCRSSMTAERTRDELEAS